MSLEIAIQPGVGKGGPPLCAQVDVGVFFPEKGESTAPAKRICAACTIRAACLQDALDRDEPWGIWGGLTAGERRRLQPSQRGGPRADRLTDEMVGVRRVA